MPSKRTSRAGRNSDGARQSFQEDPGYLLEQIREIWRQSDDRHREQTKAYETLAKRQEEANEQTQAKIDQSNSKIDKVQSQITFFKGSAWGMGFVGGLIGTSLVPALEFIASLFKKS